VARAPGSGYRGFNVTIPHKQSILPLVHSIDPVAREVGAVNTVVCHDRLQGFNTDITGFENTLRLLGVKAHSLPAVVLGAGGSARAIVFALARMGATVTVLNRSIDTASRLARAVGHGTRSGSLADMSPVCSARLLVNTTSLGMSHLPMSPLPPGVKLDPDTVVIDLVYGRTTELMVEAQAAGCTALDGVEMLVQQGAASFRLWTGREPDVDIMRNACRTALLEVMQCSAS
jgi:shikimate dehydrogenase